MKKLTKSKAEAVLHRKLLPIEIERLSFSYDECIAQSICPFCLGFMNDNSEYLQREHMFWCDGNFNENFGKNLFI